MFWGAISIQSTKGLDSSTYLVSFSDFWFGEQSSCLGILPVFGDGILLGVNVLKDLFNRFVLLNKLDGIFWSNSPKKNPNKLDSSTKFARSLKDLRQCKIHIGSNRIQ